MEIALRWLGAALRYLALLLLGQKPYVYRPSEARAGTQSKFAKFAISRPWIPALRSLRSLGRDTTETSVTQYSCLALPGGDGATVDSHELVRALQSPQSALPA